MTTKSSSTAAAAAGDQLVSVSDLLKTCVRRRPDASRIDEEARAIVATALAGATR